jgi:hypothetical protein
LKNGFDNPPNEAKARTWRHGISGHISKKGITADLEAIKRLGIQEFQWFNVALHVPKGTVDYSRNEWAVNSTLREQRRNTGVWKSTFINVRVDAPETGHGQQ